MKIKNIKTGEQSSIKVEGLFVAIGLNPNNSLVKDKVELSKDGYVKTDDRMSTSIPGVFAAGDLREKYLRQVITAAADGASAAYTAEQYINENMKNFK